MTIEPWLKYALLGAVMAACTGIFAKVGMKGIDSDLATAIRALVGTIFLFSVVTARSKWPHLQSLHYQAVCMIVLAGLAGSSSWLFQYKALAIDGPVSKVAAIDKLSVPIAVILAVIILKDRLVGINWIGVALIVIGAYCVAYKPASHVDPRRGVEIVPQNPAQSTTDASGAMPAPMTVPVTGATTGGMTKMTPGAAMPPDGSPGAS